MTAAGIYTKIKGVDKDANSVGNKSLEYITSTWQSFAISQLFLESRRIR